MQTFQAHPLIRHELSFSPDGLRCAAADNAGKMVVWDVGA